MDGELASRQCGIEGDGEFPARLDFLGHRRVEQPVAIAPVGLGPVEGEVGVAHDRGWFDRRTGGRRNADAQADFHFAILDLIRLADAGQKARCQSGGGTDVGPCEPLQDGEFIAAQTSHDVLGPGCLAEPRGHRHEKRVADRMPERVVDRLELVEIDDEDGKTGVAEACRVLHAFEEQRPIGEPGQRIVARHMGDLRCGLLTPGDVLMGRDPAAARHRLVRHQDITAIAQLFELGMMGV